MLLKIGLALVLIPSLAYAGLAAVWAATAPLLGSALPPQEYQTCAELRRTFPHGLAATEDSIEDSIERFDPAALPRVYAQAYVLNMHLDKDHDGVMCGL